MSPTSRDVSAGILDVLFRLYQVGERGVDHAGARRVVAGVCFEPVEVRRAVEDDVAFEQPNSRAIRAPAVGVSFPRRVR